VYAGANLVFHPGFLYLPTRTTIGPDSNFPRWSTPQSRTSSAPPADVTESSLAAMERATREALISTVLPTTIGVVVVIVLMVCVYRKVYDKVREKRFR